MVPKRTRAQRAKLIAEVAKLREEDQPYWLIAKQLGISKATAQRMASEAGFSGRGALPGTKRAPLPENSLDTPPDISTPESWAEFCTTVQEFHSTGSSYRAISEYLGVSYTYVYQAGKNMAFKLPREKRTTKTRTEPKPCALPHCDRPAPKESVLYRPRIQSPEGPTPGYSPGTPAHSRGAR